MVDWIKWLNSNGIFALAQAVLVFVGLLFAGRQLLFAGNQLKQARRSFQATVVAAITDRTSQLQWEVIKDDELRPLLGFPTTTDTSKTVEYKRALVIALIVNHYAYIFDLWRLGGVPDQVWDALKRDLRDWVSRPDFNERWSQLRQWHTRDFVDLVNGLIAQKAVQRPPQKDQPDKIGSQDERNA
jgi:hypothetical protein